MNILIIGGLGFIGKNLTNKLLEYGHKIFIFDTKKPNNSHKNINYFIGDFENIENYKNIFNDVDIVYHLISTTTPNYNKLTIEYDIRTNLISTIKLLNICVEKGIKKIIFTSSGGSVYGEGNKKHKEKDLTKPFYPYAINKLAIENYLSCFYKFENLDYTILRIANPYGANHVSKKQGIINVFLDKIKNQENIEIWGDGSIERDYIHIDDVVNALILSIQPTEEKIFNISSGKSTSINKLINIIQSITNTKSNITYLPKREFDIQKNVLNNSLAKKYLKWEPKISLKEGIKLLYEEIK